jgi:hypothetical protein
LDVGYVSAFFGLAGAIVGGLTSFVTSWITQRTQLTDKHREAERVIRHDLFKAFIAEASRLFGDALSHEKDDVSDLVHLYALLANMRLLSSPTVVAAAEQVMDVIIDTYLAPNLSLHEIRNLAREGKLNFLLDFAKASRVDLDLQ